MEIERDAHEWKIFFTLAEIGKPVGTFFLSLERLAPFIFADEYQFSIVDNDEEQLFGIYCVAEETDIFRNGGLDDITRLIVDKSKINDSDVNVIVKGNLGGLRTCRRGD